MKLEKLEMAMKEVWLLFKRKAGRQHSKILSQETLDKCANFNRSITMYRKLLDEKQGNGYILEDVSKAGYSTIMLWVFVDNVRAIEFYKKYGFMASGKEKTTFGAVEEIYMKEL